MKTLKTIKWSTISKNKIVVDKCKQISKMFGSPDRMEYKKNGSLYRATWLNIEGCNEIIIYNVIYKKYHPYNAIVFVIARKLFHIPQYLIGPLKYASETINIEQIQTTKKISDHYEKTGDILKSMVSGSCASIAISVITLKFVEDMVSKYKKTNTNCKSLMNKFRYEYDRRIENYLKGNGIQPKIEWFPNKLEKHEEFIKRV
tara:strand:+ start:384 stop:989 length:606 start_codon:yes stop_codon:yes gene_type:complete